MKDGLNYPDLAPIPSWFPSGGRIKQNGKFVITGKKGKGALSEVQVGPQWYG